VGHGLDGTEIAVVYRLVGETVEEFAHPFLVGGFDRAEDDGDISRKDLGAEDIGRVEMAVFGQIYLVGVEELCVLRESYQFPTIVGVRDINK
jgi:hypothetical protein